MQAKKKLTTSLNYSIVGHKIYGIAMVNTSMNKIANEDNDDVFLEI